MATLVIQKNNLDYPRNLALNKCLLGLYPDLNTNFYGKKLIAKIRLIWRADQVFFVWAAQTSLLWLLAVRLFNKKIIVDMFNFYYETYVEDRALVKKFSLKSLIYFVFDYLCVNIADEVFVDTEEHGQYMAHKYGRKKYIILPVIVDDELINSIAADKQKLAGNFNVLYCGKFIPLHGVEKIIAAAEVLRNEPINFYLQGSGQTRKQIEVLVKTLGLGNKVFFIDRLSYEEMLILMKAADVCLGVFGSSEKTKRVVPNKVLEALLCNRPVVTLNTNAMKKLEGTNGLYLINSGELVTTINNLYKQKIANIQIVVESAKILSNFGLEAGKKYLQSSLYEN